MALIPRDRHALGSAVNSFTGDFTVFKCRIAKSEATALLLAIL